MQAAPSKIPQPPEQLQAPEHEVEAEADLDAKQQEHIAAPDALPAGPGTEAMTPPGAAAVNESQTAERLKAAALDDSTKPVPSNAQASSGGCPFSVTSSGHSVTIWETMTAKI